MGKQWNQWQTLFWGAPKSLQMVIAAKTLKDAKSNKSILKETKPKYSLAGLMLKLKLQYFGHLMRLPCPSLSPRVCTNSYPLSQWYNPTISSCHPLLFLPSIFLSMGVFSSESALCIMWPKYWSFSFRISSSNEYLGLISFRIDWFDLLIFPGTLKSLL